MYSFYYLFRLRSPAVFTCQAVVPRIAGSSSNLPRAGPYPFKFSVLYVFHLQISLTIFQWAGSVFVRLSDTRSLFTS